MYEIFLKSYTRQHRAHCNIKNRRKGREREGRKGHFPSSDRNGKQPLEESRGGSKASEATATPRKSFLIFLSAHFVLCSRDAENKSEMLRMREQHHEAKGERSLFALKHAGLGTDPPPPHAFSTLPLHALVFPEGNAAATSGKTRTLVDMLSPHSAAAATAAAQNAAVRRKR